jgi:hypothetical protein
VYLPREFFCWVTNLKLDEFPEHSLTAVIWYVDVLILADSNCFFFKLHLQKYVHELRITNQVMYLNPPIEEVRVSILGELYSWEANIITLPRISHARYQVCPVAL